MWQNAADDYLCRRPTNSRQPQLDRLELCQTGRPGWPSWNPPDVEPEATAATVALAWCGRTVKRPSALHLRCSRILDRLQPAHQTLGYSVKEWVAVVRVTRSERLDQRLTWIGRAVGAAETGSSHCDTRRPPVQTATADCQWRLQGHAPSLRRWTYRLALLRFRLWPAAGENPTTQPESWWGSAGVCWPSAKSWCRWDTQWDVRRLPQRPWPKFWRRPAYHQHGAGWGHDERQRGLTQLCCFVANSQSSGFYGK